MTTPIQLFSMFQPYIDSCGLLTATKGGDEGDSCNREAAFAICAQELYNQDKIAPSELNMISDRYKSVSKKLQTARGSMARGIAPGWVSQDCVMSRDQWIPTVIAAGMLEIRSLLNFLFLGHLLRGLLFTTNTCPNGAVVGQPGYAWQLPDITVLSCWGVYIRAYKAWFLYPFLLLFDLQILVQSLIIVGNSFLSPTNTSDLFNQFNSIIQAYRVFPTPFSYLARKALSFCKHGLGSYIDAYFNTDNGSAPFGTVYNQIFEGMV